MAHIVTVHLLIPDEDKHGTPIATSADATEAVSLLLSDIGQKTGTIKDWAYLYDGESYGYPEEIKISDDYEEGEAFEAKKIYGKSI